jgi:DNA-binding NarL/FixJ family response regulator
MATINIKLKWHHLNRNNWHHPTEMAGTIRTVVSKDDTESVTYMLKAGISGYILKFADPNEMLTAVKALSENKKYFSVGVSGIATEYFHGNTGEHY